MYINCNKSNLIFTPTFVKFNNHIPVISMYSFLNICYIIGNMFYGVTVWVSAEGITNFSHNCLHRQKYTACLTYAC